MSEITLQDQYSFLSGNTPTPFWQLIKAPTAVFPKSLCFLRMSLCIKVNQMLFLSVLARQCTNVFIISVIMNSPIFYTYFLATAFINIKSMFFVFNSYKINMHSYFKEELAPMEVKGKKGQDLFVADEYQLSKRNNVSETGSTQASV